MLALCCVAGGFFGVLFSFVVKSKRFSSAFSPRPLPDHVLFRPRFNFRATVTLTLRTTKEINTTKTASYAGYLNMFVMNNLFIE